MIRCISYVKNHNSPNLYKVKLIANSIPIHMPVNGKDIMGLSNSIIFEKGSELLICINGQIDKYIYGENGFIPINREINITDFSDLKIDDDGTVYIN